MKSLYQFIFLIFCLITILSCTDEISLVTDFEPQTFIFGNLTNSTDYITIYIQETVPVDSLSTTPINNAGISLFTKDPGSNTSLVTNNFMATDGVYISSEIISPVVGNYYWIEVVLQDGTTFKSEQELLKSPIIINTVTTNNGGTRVHFNDPEDESNFYRLELSSSDNGVLTKVNKLSNDVLFNGNENAFIEIESTMENNISTTLINLNFSTYQFYLNVTAQDNLNDGSSGDSDQLFAPPPVNLTGNITNTTLNRTALGNFGVISFDSY